MESITLLEYGSEYTKLKIEQYPTPNVVEFTDKNGNLLYSSCEDIDKKYQKWFYSHF